MKITKNKLVIVLVVFNLIQLLITDGLREKNEELKTNYKTCQTDLLILDDEYNTVINHLNDAQGPLNTNEYDTPTLEKQSATSLKTIDVCSTSSTKTYMSYKAITNKASAQYKYIRKYMAIDYNGLLVDKDGYIGVALGSSFKEIGTRYIFTLDTGVVLKVVKVEAKSDKHTISGCQQKYDGSVIEFVVDTELAGKHYGYLSNKYILNGNFNNHKDFKGKIEKIEEVK